MLRSDGTPKKTRVIGGRPYVLEYQIHRDVALIKALAGDRWGNLVYCKAARNFGPVMSTAARFTVASVIIGKPGRDIAESDAWGHVAGYSCYAGPVGAFVDRLA